jgi:ATP-dependent RNA helicase RhlE
MKTFEDLNIAKSILKSLDDLGIVVPTPIQEKAIPRINSGNNVLGIAQTGTGKTAAYLLPLLSKLKKPEGKDPRVLVLVPTRELSIQVGNDLADFTVWSELRHAAVFGGVGWTKHAELIEPGIDVLVATPGRLKDLYQTGFLSLKKIKYLVIDEADRMLDMGFLPQLRKLFEILPSNRQNLLFSATFSESVEKLVSEFLDFYEKIETSPSATPVQEVSQYAYRVPNYRTKLNLVRSLLDDEIAWSRVIIFVKTKGHADEVFSVIKRKSEGEKRILHSNKGQNMRINAIRDFKEGKVRILITTDVSARGIDASSVSHVINFDVPLNYEDYIHRIGRTARAGRRGDAITLIDPSEEWHWEKIEKLIRMKIPLRNIPPDVEIFETGFEEKQKQLREIDRQRKIDDPTFPGAFHSKKKTSRGRGRFSGKMANSGKKLRGKKSRRN